MSNVALGAAAMMLPNVLFSDAARTKEKLPNIILFLSDDHGILDSGCYGNNVVRTPNLDRLAKEGVRFTGAFAASPTGAPSRSVLYTGLYPHRNGAHPNHSWVRAGIKSLPHYLSKLGYKVVLAGKAGIGPKELFPFKYIRRGAGVGEFIANVGSQPICLVIGTNDPHVKWKENTFYKPSDVKLPPYLVDTKETRKAMTDYYTSVTSMDSELGTTLDLLKKHGLEENALFIYTSDQGAQWPHAKWNLYDAGINVPFIARWPGKIKPGTVTDAMISFVDVLPTFVEIAGGKPPDDLDGKSFLPVLPGKKKNHREVIYATHTRDTSRNFFPMRAIRTKTHKYILNLNPERAYTTHITNARVRDGYGYWEYWESWMEKGNFDKLARDQIKMYQQRPSEELYDLRVDPYELSNIADDPARKKLKASLCRQLEEWMKQQGDLGREEELPPIDGQRWY